MAASAIERIERVGGPESAAKVERLLDMLAKRWEDLAENEGSAHLEIHINVHRRKYVGGTFDPDLRVD